MATTKFNKQQAQQDALDRLARNFPSAEVWKATLTRIVVWFPAEEQVYVYAVPTTPEEARLHHVPGRPIVAVHRCDSSDDEFRKLCEALA